MKQKLFQSSRYTLVMLWSVLLATPLVAHAQSFSGFLLSVRDILNGIIPILIGIAAVMFIWGLVTLIGNTEDAEKKKAANGRMVFGIVVLTVMLGVWGLVNLLVNTLNLDTYAPPPVQVSPDAVSGVVDGGGALRPEPNSLVPCGNYGNFCTACDIYKLLHNIMNYLMFLVVPLAVLSISIGGAYILFGSGVNEGWVTTGKGYIWTALWGIIVVLVAWLVINTIVVNLANPGVFQGPWSAISC